MKTKILLRALSLFLVLCSIISIFPLSAFATHEHGSDHCIDENCNTCDFPLVGEGITVALLDSGVQSYPVHTAVDFVGAEEVSSHGDEMAEVLLENAPGVTLLDVRVLNAEGIGVHSKVSEGILWATNHGAQIIVMSFAGLENTRVLKEAVEYAAEHGVVMVAAAGNDMKNTATFPAAYAQVLSVGALDAQGGIALGSNSGAYVDLYVEAQGGTSHAAQVVAANVAKLMQSRPEATSDEIYDELSTLVYKSDLLVEQSEDGMVYASACLIHKWGSYSTTRSATCTSTGQKVRYCSKCGKAQYATISALGHSARSYYNTISYATCTSAGSKVKYCVRCSYVCERVTLNALGHSWSGYTTTKAATCTATGQKCKTCTRCGTKSYTTIAALGHSKSSSPSLTVQATCTKEGYSVYRCVRCSVELSRITLAKRAHTLGSYTVVKAPTCTQQGTQAQICSSCKGQFNSKSIPATGHSYGNYVTTKNPTCTETGLKVKKCSKCGSESSSTIAKIPHAIYTEEKMELSDICDAIYYTRTRCKNCNTNFGGFKESRRVPGQHVLGEMKVLKAATCTEAGKRGQQCKNCGLSFNTTSIAKLPHDIYMVEQRRQVGCVVGYYSQPKCRNCTTEFEETETVTVEHTPGYRQSKPATCLEAEQIEVYCTACGDHISYFDGDERTGHDPDPNKGTEVLQEATCEQFGLIRKWCKLCEQPYNTVTGKTDHNEKKVVVKHASCNSDGKVEYVCTRCDETLRTEIIPATGEHEMSMDTTVSITEATCIANGSVWGPCVECGDVFEEIIPHTAFNTALAHMDGWIRLGNSFMCEECPTGEFQFRHVTDLMTESEQVEFIKEWVWHIADDSTVEDRKGDCSGVVDYLQGYKVMTVTLPCDSNTAGSEGKILPWTLETDAMADFLEEMRKKYLLGAATAGIDYVLSKADIIGLAGILGDVDEMWKDFTKWNEIRKYGTELAELSSKIVFDGDMYLEEKITLVYVYREQFDENHQGYGWIYCGSRNVVSPTTTIRVSSGSNYYDWEFSQPDQYIDISDEQFYQDCIAAYEDGRCAEYLVQHVNYTDENGVVRVATPSNMQQMKEIFPGYFMIPNY